MKKTILSTLALFSVAVAFSQTARVQIIHNSADAAAASVDIYVDDALALDNFAFREATPFIDLTADTEIVIGVAPPDSMSSMDAIATFPITLASGSTYIVVADGIVSGSGYDPAPAFGLAVYDMGREAATSGSNTDVLVHHGSTDAPIVDVAEVGVGAGTIVDDLAYTDFQGYLELPTDDYILQIQDQTGSVGVAAFEAPLATLMLEGVALVVVASGFLNPANNSDGPAFGLFAASPAGGEMLALPFIQLSANDFAINEIAVYPNPARDVLYIEGTEMDSLNIQVVDLQGRVVYNGPYSAQTGLNVNGLNAGMYQLVFLNGNDVVGTKKFMKN